MKSSLSLLFISGLVLVLVFSGCKKDDDPPMTPTGPSSNATYWLIGSIDNAPLSIEVTNSNLLGLGYSNSGSIGSIFCKFDYGCIIEDFAFGSDEPGFGVNLFNWYDDSCHIESDLFFSTLFTNGEVPFADSASTTIRSIVLTYTDANDIQYTTYGNQSGSSFNVTGATMTSNILGDFMDVTGIVNCNLYNDQGNVIQLSNGEFKISFQPHQ